ncbi:single-strand selective monofunctional uracil DNA glycosylase [Neocloeon triangulifer]|uniref:single-strand selective monofunctional uracil DNA glycosylase n=1 Tax=Neocloeon triangulifer TaxID=2078957 RepID=UPI00286EF5E6|nr:single-strand selective monofunctional uracil DNA glycosylase [Neocloeon triangulifer]
MASWQQYSNAGDREPEENKFSTVSSSSQFISMAPGNYDTASQFFSVQLWLSGQLKLLKFSDPVFMVYDPVEYAGGIYFQYLQRFCRSPKHLLILGMNPGPWGMGQTGIPFGDVDTVKNYLGLAEFGFLIRQPTQQHPSKIVTGLDCHRKEPSGTKLWGLVKKLTNYCPAEIALANIIVHNFCPLIFLKESGCNLTPEELKASNKKEELFNLCSTALYHSLRVLQCSQILCIGKFAEKRADLMVKKFSLNALVYSIPHPSPRNVSGRVNWEENAMASLSASGLLQFI